MATLELDDLPEPDVLEGSLEPRREAPVEHVSVQLAKVEALQSLQDEILTASAEKVRDGLYFDEIDPKAEEPPQKWIDELGEDRAWRRFRTARYNLMCAQEAPVGTKLAAQVFVGIVRAKATEKGGPVRLNVEKVFLMERAPTEYPRQELEQET